MVWILLHWRIGLDRVEEGGIAKARLTGDLSKTVYFVDGNHEAREWNFWKDAGSPLWALIVRQHLCLEQKAMDVRELESVGSVGGEVWEKASRVQKKKGLIQHQREMFIAGSQRPGGKEIRKTCRLSVVAGVVRGKGWGERSHGFQEGRCCAAKRYRRKPSMFYLPGAQKCSEVKKKKFR